MYTEDYDELSEAENKPQRQYVSSIPHSESGKLLRENDRLKKSLEKEQFFNKLLDQELKDLKATLDPNASYNADVYERPQGVSKGAFYTLLLITLGLAGYIGYGYYNSNFKNPAASSNSVVPAAVLPAASTDTVPNIISNNAANKNAAAKVKDNKTNNKLPEFAENSTTAVPEKKIVPENKIQSKPESKVVENKDEVQPSAAVNDPSQEVTATDNTTPVTTKPNTESVENNAAPNNTATNTETTAPANTTINKAAENSAITQNQPAAAVPDNRPVIAYYTVTSKANFYTRPDENTMRSAFIAQYNNTKVGALEETNGFIYVVYTNDLGYTLKGWLSMKDLTKVQ